MSSAPLVEKIPVSAQREVHVQINTYKGREELDIRSWVISENYTGYTPKGIRLPKEIGRPLIEALDKVLRDKGL